MTTELEKTFFDTFGIEKKQRKACVDENTLCPTPEKECEECSYYQYIHEYPQIEDRHYLELICIDFTENPYKCRGNVDNVEELKNYILEQFIHEFENDLYLDKESVKHQVQAIFEGER